MTYCIHVHVCTCQQEESYNLRKESTSPLSTGSYDIIDDDAILATFKDQTLIFLHDGEKPTVSRDVSMVAVSTSDRGIIIFVQYVQHGFSSMCLSIFFSRGNQGKGWVWHLI